MTRKDLAGEVAMNMGLSRALVREVIDGSLSAICESLVRGERVELRNFGVFTTRAMGERVVKIPKTKDAIRIPATTVVRFKPGKELKRKVA